MTDILTQQHTYQAHHAARDARRDAARDDRRADVPFLRRILIGLVAATVLSGAVTLALATQHELVEGLQVASAHGPA